MFMRLLRLLGKTSKQNPISAFVTISGSCALIGVVVYRWYVRQPPAKVAQYIISFTNLMRLAMEEGANVEVKGNLWFANLYPKNESASNSASSAAGSAAQEASSAAVEYVARCGPEVLAVHQTLLERLIQAGKLNITQMPREVESQLSKLGSIVLTTAVTGLTFGLLVRLMMPGKPDDDWKPRSKREQSKQDARCIPGVTFAAVAGLEGPKRELQEPVAYLQATRHAGAHTHTQGAAAPSTSAAPTLLELGGRPPRGVLLAGPPGCGKTMLARAVAGEAGVPFFDVSGSEFVEMYVGRGAARVRELFRRARAAAPCVVFVDELDAVGQRRGGFKSHQEREATLNQLLVELDGLSSGGASDGEGFLDWLLGDSDSSDAEDGDEGEAGAAAALARAPRVLFLAATNQVDVLDPALLRPGRFDRIVHVPLPDSVARGAVLDQHMQRLVWAADDAWANVRSHVVTHTAGANSAQLEAIANETAVMAQRRGAKGVQASDVAAAVSKVMSMRSTGGQ